MNYYIDLIPDMDFLKEMDKRVLNKNKDDNIIFNMYIKQLPSMNTNEFIYCDIKECFNLINEIKKRNCRVNIMFDAFCFGNREFTEQGKQIFKLLDEILSLGIDFITITNYFFLNYIKSRCKNCKIIMSEYAEITNLQKICRYIEEIKVDGVKLSSELLQRKDSIEQIQKSFNLNFIHIDINKTYYENDIYKDSLNNSISHYIQENKWKELNEYIEEYENMQIRLKHKKIGFSKDDIINLKKREYQNFWYCCNQKKNKYIEMLLNDLI